MARRATKVKTASSVIDSLNFKLKDIEPLTDNQADFFDSYDEGKEQMLLGYSGTGKTYIALYKAFKELEDGGEFKRIVIVRSAVSTRDIGFLPGNEQEKAAVYTLPYKKILSDLFGRDDAYEVLEKHDVLRFMLTSYVRGLSVDNSIIIIDEAQNLTSHEADSVLTRLGNNSRVVICGDILQRDLSSHKERDIEKFIDVIKSMPDYFDITYFGIDDIVRSGLVREYIKAKHRLFIDGY